MSQRRQSEQNLAQKEVGMNEIRIRLCVFKLLQKTIAMVYFSKQPVMVSSMMLLTQTVKFCLRKFIDGFHLV